jgi:hypothetical protein
VTEKRRAGSLCEGRPEARVKPKNRSQQAAFTVSRQKLQTPPRLAQPKPKPRPEPEAAKPIAAPPDPFVGLERLGSWFLIRLDATQKRAAAKCTLCGDVKEIGLTDGIPSCGCAASLRSDTASFAARVVAEERYVAASRHRGRR